MTLQLTRSCLNRSGLFVAGLDSHGDIEVISGSPADVLPEDRFEVALFNVNGFEFGAPLVKLTITGTQWITCNAGLLGVVQELLRPTVDAIFQPEAWVNGVNDRVVSIDGRFNFDALPQLLKIEFGQLREMFLGGGDFDVLCEGVPQAQGHNGPYEVRVCRPEELPFKVRLFNGVTPKGGVESLAFGEDIAEHFDEAMWDRYRDVVRQVLAHVPQPAQSHKKAQYEMVDLLRAALQMQGCSQSYARAAAEKTLQSADAHGKSLDELFVLTKRRLDAGGGSNSFWIERAQLATPKELRDFVAPTNLLARAKSALQQEANGASVWLTEDRLAAWLLQNAVRDMKPEQIACEMARLAMSQPGPELLAFADRMGLAQRDVVFDVPPVRIVMGLEGGMPTGASVDTPLSAVELLVLDYDTEDDNEAQTFFNPTARDTVDAVLRPQGELCVDHGFVTAAFSAAEGDEPVAEEQEAGTPRDNRERA